MRSQTGESAVGKPVFLVHDVVDIIADDSVEWEGVIAEARLDHGCADGTRIIESMRVYHTAHVTVNLLSFLVKGLKCRSCFG